MGFTWLIDDYDGVSGTTNVLSIFAVYSKRNLKLLFEKPVLSAC